MICIVDYGMGNLRSVSKAIEALGGHARVSSQPNQIARADKIILPGVGAFGDAVSELKKRRLRVPLQESIRKQKPFLGICLGLQLLFETSEESPKSKGLGIFKGRVRRFGETKKKLKVPHMGWNQVRFTRSSPLIRGIQNDAYFYFVHSYYAEPNEKKIVLGITNYGKPFPSILSQEPFFSVQFHPEKSQQAGLRILKNFIQY